MTGDERRELIARLDAARREREAARPTRPPDKRKLSRNPRAIYARRKRREQARELKKIRAMSYEQLADLRRAFLPVE